MKRILVADDNAASRELMREALEASGYEVCEAADGLEALAEIERCMPDLVLLDVQMPQLDGYATLARLRAEPRFASLRVIALTAFAMRGDRDKALAAGFDDYIAKPVDISGLRKRVQLLLC